MQKAFGPAGQRIRGTLETVQVVAIGVALRVSVGAEVNVVWQGDTANASPLETVTRDGQRVFVDEDGNEWRESQLTWEDNSGDKE